VWAIRATIGTNLLAMLGWELTVGNISTFSFILIKKLMNMTNELQIKIIVFSHVLDEHETLQ
jgi:hypothetical protein